MISSCQNQHTHHENHIHPNHIRPEVLHCDRNRLMSFPIQGKEINVHYHIIQNCNGDCSWLWYRQLSLKNDTGSACSRRSCRKASSREIGIALIKPANMNTNVLHRTQHIQVSQPDSPVVPVSVTLDSAISPSERYNHNKYEQIIQDRQILFYFYPRQYRTSHCRQR